MPTTAASLLSIALSFAVLLSSVAASTAPRKRQALRPAIEPLRSLTPIGSHLNTQLTAVPQTDGEQDAALAAAQSAYERAVPDDRVGQPNTYGPSWAYAAELSRVKRYQEAINVLRPLVEPMGNRGYTEQVGDLLTEIGQCHFLDKEFDKAVVELRRAIEVSQALEDPDHVRRRIVRPLRLLAECGLAAGDYESAAEALDELAPIQPMNAMQASLRGQLLLRSGEPREAIGFLKRALSMRLGRVNVAALNQGGKQTGFTSPGSPGMAWRRMKLRLTEERNKRQVKWFVDDLEIGSVTESPDQPFPSEGRIALGYMDPYASVSAAPEYSFGVIDNLRISGAFVHTDDFERQTSDLYDKQESAGAASAEFFVDYSKLGVPPSPGSTVGATHGVRFTANQQPPGRPAGVTLFVGPVTREECEVSFDAWINFPGPYDAPVNGTTEYVTLGVLSNAELVNLPHKSSGSGVWVAMDGDGKASRDFRFFVGPTEVVHFDSAFGGNELQWPDAIADYFAGRGSPAQEHLWLALAYHKLGNHAAAKAAWRDAQDHLKRFPAERLDLSDLMKEVEGQLDIAPEKQPQEARGG